MAKISGNNGVPVLATVFLLSYAKLFSTVVKVISFTTLRTTQGEKSVWSVDGNIDYLGPKHAPLFVTAVIACVFLWLPYTFLLLCGTYLRKSNISFLKKFLMKLKPFLDANYAPFHDRHQCWFGGILIVKAVVILSSALTPTDSAHILVYSVALESLLLTSLGQMVYSKNATTLLNTWLFVNLSILNITKLLNIVSDMSVASYTLIGLTLILFLKLILIKIIKYTTIMWNNSRRFQNADEDDGWELYLQASKEREVESESCNSFDSIDSLESLPTY